MTDYDCVSQYKQTRYHKCIIETSNWLPTVLGCIYELLGVLGEVHPSEMVNNSEKLYKAYLGELKGQVKASHPHMDMFSYVHV